MATTANNTLVITGTSTKTSFTFGSITGTIERREKKIDRIEFNRPDGGGSVNETGEVSLWGIPRADIRQASSEVAGMLDAIFGTEPGAGGGTDTDAETQTA